MEKGSYQVATVNEEHIPFCVRNVKAKGGVQDPATAAVPGGGSGSKCHSRRGGRASLGGQGLVSGKWPVGSGWTERAGKVNCQVRDGLDAIVSATGGTGTALRRGTKRQF